jgi:hypothetical protein
VYCGFDYSRTRTFDSERPDPPLLRGVRARCLACGALRHPPGLTRPCSPRRGRHRPRAGRHAGLQRGGRPGAGGAGGWSKEAAGSWQGRRPPIARPLKPRQRGPSAPQAPSASLSAAQPAPDPPGPVASRSPRATCPATAPPPRHPHPSPQPSPPPSPAGRLPKVLRRRAHRRGPHPAVAQLQRRRRGQQRASHLEVWQGQGGDQLQDQLRAGRRAGGPGEGALQRAAPLPSCRCRRSCSRPATPAAAQRVTGRPMPRRPRRRRPQARAAPRRATSPGRWTTPPPRWRAWAPPPAPTPLPSLRRAPASRVGRRLAPGRGWPRARGGGALVLVPGAPCAAPDDDASAGACAAACQPSLRPLPPAAAAAAAAGDGDGKAKGYGAPAGYPGAQPYPHPYPGACPCLWPLDASTAAAPCSSSAPTSSSAAPRRPVPSAGLRRPWLRCPRLPGPGRLPARLQPGARRSVPGASCGSGRRCGDCAARCTARVRGCLPTAFPPDAGYPGATSAYGAPPPGAPPAARCPRCCLLGAGPIGHRCAPRGPQPARHSRPLCCRRPAGYPGANSYSYSSSQQHPYGSSHQSYQAQHYSSSHNGYHNGRPSNGYHNGSHNNGYHNGRPSSGIGGAALGIGGGLLAGMLIGDMLFD